MESGQCATPEPRALMRSMSAGASRLPWASTVRRRQQPEAVEHLGVADAMAGKSVAMLPVALGAMGLHRAAAFLRHRAEPFEHRVGAGGHEARRDHRLDQAAIVGMGADIVDQRPRSRDPGFGRGVAVPGRALLGIVHRHLADKGPLALPQAGVDEHLGGVVVDRREIDGGRRAVVEEVADQRRINRARRNRGRRSAPRAETCMRCSQTSSGTSSALPSCGYCGAWM